jgi:dimethylaniline monooxygenase (N-oxide forming)
MLIVIYLSRFDEGKPLDFLSPRRMLHIEYALEKYLPSLGGWMMDYFCNQIRKKHFAIELAWRLFPGPSLTTNVPLVHDKIVSLLTAGDVVSVHRLSHFLDASTVELLDGTKLEVDAVGYCTGYEADFSLLGPDLDPTSKAMEIQVLVMHASIRISFHPTTQIQLHI